MNVYSFEYLEAPSLFLLPESGCPDWGNNARERVCWYIITIWITLCSLFSLVLFSYAAFTLTLQRERDFLDPFTSNSRCECFCFSAIYSSQHHHHLSSSSLFPLSVHYYLGVLVTLKRPFCCCTFLWAFVILNAFVYSCFVLNNLRNTVV